MGDKFTFTIAAGSRHKSIIILLIFAIISFCIPIVVFIALVSVGENAIMGLFVSAIICWLTAWYLFRLYLWNKFGQEVYIFEKNKLTSYYNYKYFKDKYKEIDFDRVEISFYYDGDIFAVGEGVLSEDISDLYASQVFIDTNGGSIISFKEIPISEIINLGHRVYGLCIEELNVYNS